VALANGTIVSKDATGVKVSRPPPPLLPEHLGSERSRVRSVSQEKEGHTSLRFSVLWTSAGLSDWTCPVCCPRCLSRAPCGCLPTGACLAPSGWWPVAGGWTGTTTPTTPTWHGKPALPNRFPTPSIWGQHNLVTVSNRSINVYDLIKGRTASKRVFTSAGMALIPTWFVLQF
jgi:hypothetical protein